ncbi:MAG: crossover junction endodeoxyribonuclease RuvC [Acidobacteria bacterium]|nr:crossover junction endodeoxyribonuclease RuvC [Acidobacteriota bacterium]
MRVFGIDPGSIRTGYGCIDTTGSRHTLVTCGALVMPTGASLPDRLHAIFSGLGALLADVRPDCVAVESVFHAANARSALVLGHARAAAILAAVEASFPVAEYTPAEIKRAVTGYGRAEKQQIQQMTKLLLGLEAVPSPHDAADALAIAICHVHQVMPAGVVAAPAPATGKGRTPRTWRQWKP